MKKTDINPTRFEEIPPFPEDAKDKYVIHGIIETPRDIRHKYALHAKYGIFALRQTIPEGLKWPYDYGFIPQTIGEDGDPLDVLFMDDDPTFPGCLVQARLLGIIRLLKNGEENDRLVSCAPRFDGVSQRTDSFDDIDDVPKEIVDSMSRFLTQYSSEEDNEIEFKGVESRKKALQALGAGHKAWKKQRKKH
ncbi:MAG: inorganic diphosphatase [Candidatus Eremiobacteraeota bacterium]|nr:inorganic diphosphatase [Candidatus Eremiobacteraeota bacterium]